MAGVFTIFLAWETKKNKVNEISSLDGYKIINGRRFDENSLERIKLTSRNNINIEELDKDALFNKVILDENVSNKEKNNIVIAATTGTAFIGVGIVVIFLFIELFSVEVYTYNSQQKKKKIGRMLIYKMGNVYYGFVKGGLTEKSETGIYEICFAEEFVEKNINSTILIKIKNTTISEVVKPIIHIKESI